MNTMVKILTYYLPLKKIKYLSIRDAETEVIGLLMSTSNENNHSSMIGISSEDIRRSDRIKSKLKKR